MLLEGLRAGDEASFERLFHRHYDRVFHLLHQLMGNPEEAEELAQEVFIRLHRRPLPRGDPRGDNVSGWLYRVATNLGYNALRGRKRRERREYEAMRNTPLAAPSAAAEAEAAVREREVRAALACLKPRQGQLLLLRQMGFSYRELADALDVSPSSIGTLLARAERAFRDAYEGGGHERVSG
jgi:RNA polymerase sigma-70 factor (ECF subfamily)